MATETTYDPALAWPIEEVESVDHCMQRLAAPGVFWHGSHRPWPSLSSLLDLRLQDWKTPDDRHMQAEYDLLTRFVEQGMLHLEPGARRHIEDGRLRWGTTCHTGTLFAARHFGLPTRAIDWTHASHVALFFACRRSPTETGHVWWADAAVLEAVLRTQWSAHYGKESGVANDIERDFTERRERDVLTMLHYPLYMARAAYQSAFVMLALRFGMDHAEHLFKMGLRCCGRISIRASLKRPVLERLDFLGMNGHTLDIGGSTCESIAMDVGEDVKPRYLPVGPTPPTPAP